MKRYIHIGYAKSGSTWLQNIFFSQHKQLYHLGKFNGSQVIDDNIQHAFRSALIEQPEFIYDHELVAGHFLKHFIDAFSIGKRACGISHELLTNSVNGRVDLAERARRIANIFDHDAEIVMVVRNQFDYIKSLYSGLLVEGGMPLDFKEFLFYFYYDRDRSSMSDLYYDKVYKLYADLFGKEKVHVLPYELLIKGEPLGFVNSLCDVLEVDRLTEIDEQRVNKRRSAKELSLILLRNKEQRHCLGNHVFERPWGFVYASVYQNILKVNPPEQIMKSQKKYLETWQLSELDVDQYEEEFGELKPLALRMDSSYLQVFTGEFSESNRRFADMANVDLSQFSYPV